MGVTRIFLSHSHQDNEWCSAFVDELKRYGVDIWFDKQSLYVGAKWLQTIETELEGRDTFLVVLSPASWSSSWVRDEIGLALAQHKRIVSVLHQPTQISGFITMYQMLNVIGLSSIEAARLVATALELARSEQPATSIRVSAGVQSAAEEYEYFEIEAAHGPGYFSYFIGDINGTQIFHDSNFLFEGDPGQNSGARWFAIERLRIFAKANGLEEFSEKGAMWYSYRFWRKKQ